WGWPTVETPVETAPAPDPQDPESEAPEAIVRRIRRIALGAYAAFAIYLSLAGGLRAVIGLTCSAAVIMINFLWLEEIVNTILQPAPRLRAWRLSLRTLARFALLGTALSVAIFVARFNSLSVLLGFSIVVVGIMGEALYSTYRSFTG
ncbi:MAG TPA: hypothetical protein VEZ11_10030, partial [Thermoanaerobaculia bacterium]|nr:hypothetical protein [Thermoanaerobaculia bacterium]